MSNLIKFDPFAEIQALQKQFFSDDWFSPIKSMQMPTSDVYTLSGDKDLHVEADLLRFLQRLVSIHLDGAVVGEQILAAVIRRDESEALGVVEPLHCTCSHV